MRTISHCTLAQTTFLYPGTKTSSSAQGDIRDNFLHGRNPIYDSQEPWCERWIKRTTRISMLKVLWKILSCQYIFVTPDDVYRASHTENLRKMILFCQSLSFTHISIRGHRFHCQFPRRIESPVNELTGFKDRITATKPI